MGVEHFDDLGEVGERARQSVDLVNDDDANLAPLHGLQQPRQRRPVHAATREAAVVEVATHRSPAFVSLALDEGLAGLACACSELKFCSSPSSVDLRV